jgi:hypothetical protein
MDIEQGFVLALFLALAVLCGYVRGHRDGIGDAHRLARHHLAKLRRELGP